MYSGRGLCHYKAAASSQGQAAVPHGAISFLDEPLKDIIILVTFQFESHCSALSHAKILHLPRSGRMMDSVQMAAALHLQKATSRERRRKKKKKSNPVSCSTILEPSRSLILLGLRR